MKLVIVIEDHIQPVYWVDDLIERLTNDRTQVIKCKSQIELNALYRKYGKKMNYAKIIVLNSLSEAPISIFRLNEHFRVTPKTVLLWLYLERFEMSWLNLSRIIFKMPNVCNVILNDTYVIDSFFARIPKHSMMNTTFTSYPVIYPDTSLKINKSNSIAIDAPEYMLNDIEQISIILSKETGYTVTPLSIPGKLCDKEKFMQFVNECKVLIDLKPISWIGDTLIQATNRDCIVVTEKINYGWFARHCVHDVKYHVDKTVFESVPNFITAMPSIKFMLQEIIESYDSIISMHRKRIDQLIEKCFNTDKFIETV